MKITCESCNTRFHLADGQIPPQGARVRCSRCGHRFRVVPKTGRGDASGAQHTALPTPKTRSPQRLAEELDIERLENPQFLFGDASVTLPTRTPAEAIPAAPSPATSFAEAVEDTTSLGGFGDEEDETFADRDFLGDADLGVDDAPALVESGLGADEDSVFGDVMEPDTQFEFAPPSVPEAARSRAAPAPPEPLREEVVPEPLDPGPVPLGTIPSEPVATPGPSPSPARARSAAEPQGPATPRFPLEASPLRVSAASPREGEPRAGFPTVRITALALGVLLVLSSLRAMWLRLEPARGPESVEAAGWVASDVEAHHARDERGRRVLVIRGRLEVRQPVPRPRVLVALLDRRGDRLGATTPAWLERLDGRELSPRALLRRLHQEPPTRAEGRPGTPPEGFTALVPDPPSAAARFQIVLD